MISRYAKTPRLNFGAQHGTSRVIEQIRLGIKNGTIGYKEDVLRGAERLDTVAGEVYGEARYWWVIAAASEIGWPLQCPPGTIIKIPNLDQVLMLVG